jgi:hypothetical protein
MTDSALMRAALMAYSWLTKTEMKAFASKDLAEAYIWVTRDLDTRPEDVKAAVEGCYWENCWVKWNERKPLVGRKVSPMLMLGGRASFAHQDGVAIV